MGGLFPLVGTTCLGCDTCVFPTYDPYSGWRVATCPTCGATVWLKYTNPNVYR